MSEHAYPMVRLCEIVNYQRPDKYIITTPHHDTGEIPVLTAGKTFILGYTSETHNVYCADLLNPVIIFDDFTTSYQWVDFNFTVKSSAMKILSAKNKEIAITRYIFYAMNCINYTPVSHQRQWIRKYSQLEIPLPPVDVQQKIIYTLDNLTCSLTELTTSFTAELTVRQTQYEYYLKKLLGFTN